MAKKTVVEKAFHEVYHKEPAVVGKTRRKEGPEAARKQKIAIALSKARAAGADIPKKHEGGNIEESGIYELQKGEKVIPAGGTKGRLQGDPNANPETKGFLQNVHSALPEGDRSNVSISLRRDKEKGNATLSVRPGGSSNPGSSNSNSGSSSTGFGQERAYGNLGKHSKSYDESGHLDKSERPAKESGICHSQDAGPQGSQGHRPPVQAVKDAQHEPGTAKRLASDQVKKTGVN